jgi:hypothetical protein
VAIKIIEVEPDGTESSEPPSSFSSITAEFLFAGRAFFRVMNPKNECLLYKNGIRSGRAGTQWSGEPSYFLSVFDPLTQGFVYIGVVTPDTGVIVSTGRSKFLRGQKEFDAAEWAIRVTINRDPVAYGYRIFHDGRCGRCGRTLADRGARETGLHLDCVTSNSDVHLGDS